MNVLPFVSIFLIVIALFSVSSLKDYKLSLSKKKILTGSLQVERLLRNKLYEKTYKRVPEKNLKEIDPTKALTRAPSTKNKSSRTFSREEPRRFVKFGLLLLLEQEHPELEALYAKVISRLYQNHERFTKVNFSKLLKEMISSGKDTLELKSIEDISFLDLYPKDSVLAKAYYKMLSGTHEYLLGKPFGYPALTEIFSLDKTEQKPIAFGGLNSFFLETFFGSEAALAILDKEKSEQEQTQGKRQTLNESQLKTILHEKLPSSLEGDKLIEYFYFEKPTIGKLDTVCFDKDTHIKASKPHL